VLGAQGTCVLELTFALGAAYKRVAPRRQNTCHPPTSSAGTKSSLLATPAVLARQTKASRTDKTISVYQLQHGGFPPVHPAARVARLHPRSDACAVVEHHHRRSHNAFNPVTSSQSLRDYRAARKHPHSPPLRPQHLSPRTLPTREQTLPQHCRSFIEVAERLVPQIQRSPLPFYGRGSRDLA
jgi:hypothetical protein